MNELDGISLDQSSDAYKRLVGQTPAAFVLSTYTVTTLPDAAMWKYGVIYVTDQSTGAEPAVSDGTNWRIFSTRAIVS
jgi:hypothetical protein